MVLSLLGATLAISLATSLLIVRLFRNPIRAILDRVVADAIAAAWQRYLSLAIVVVGISGGVQIWKIEQYLNPPKDQAPLELTGERWVLEVYRTVIGTAQSITWMLLVFFVFALIAYVLVRNAERKQAS